MFFLRIAFLRNLLMKIMDARLPGARAGILCRKRYIDEILAKSMNNKIDSVVILGSGFDTLAYRLPEISSIPIYELDFPDNIAEKMDSIIRLKAGRIPDVRFISIDFDNQEIEPLLVDSGYDCGHRSFFVLEGVMQYLTEGTFRKIMAFLSKVAGGSMIILTYILRDFIEGKNLHDLDIMYQRVRIESRTWKLGYYPDEIRDLLQEYKWAAIEDIGNKEYQERYIKPTGRNIAALEIERTVLAIKE